MTRNDKLKGCFLLGACGDALGAPLEGIRKLEKIIALHGPSGLSDIIEFKNAYGEVGVDYPAGRVTDDTTMAMTTAAAMLMTPLAPRPSLGADLRPLMWQGYLNWARFQNDGAALAPRIDSALPWPALARDFWFACGAGAGTIAALAQAAPGTVEAPHTYECTVRNKTVKSPNAGCGGMMRVAPLAFVEGLAPADIFALGCDNGAITHGASSAFVATGATALLVHFAAAGMDMEAALDETQKILRAHETHPHYGPGAAACDAAIAHARTRAASGAPALAAIDALPQELGHANPFLAVPVLAQVAYALSASRTLSVADTLVLAANHSGDSDSVAAIVGNILGASGGTAAVPEKWAKTLLQRAEIERMADALDAALLPAPPRQAALPALKRA